MRAITLIPLAGLVSMAVLCVLAQRDAPPLEASFGQPPAEADLPSPVLELGEEHLQGRLLGADDEPIEGASLFVVQNGRPLWTVTDTLGAFRFDDLLPGSVEVDIHAPGHIAATAEVEVGGEPATLRLSEALPSPPRLPDPEPVDLEGAIEGPGTDLSDFEVALLPTAPATEPGTGVPRRARCDAEGRFRFEALTPAQYACSSAEVSASRFLATCFAAR